METTQGAEAMTTKITMRAGLALLVLAGLAARPAAAASAVAADGRGGYAYVTGAATEAEAVERALSSCRKRTGGACTVVVACDGSGYGAIYYRRTPGRPYQGLGASCGAPDPAAAYEQARLACRRATGGAMCGGPKVAWQDRVE